MSKIAEIVEDGECFICWEKLDVKKHVKCVRCNISLHKTCESTYRNEKGYTKCPHCQRIGVLGALRQT
jgi:hypothetical protein